jgi:phage-related holin
MIDERTYVLKWLKPLVGLADQANWKVPLAVIAGLLMEQLEHLANIDPTYVVAMVLLVAADFVTGVIRSRSMGARFRSIRVRSTVIKSLEYTFFLGATSVLANTFTVVAWVDDTAFFLACLTEWVSITENIGSSGVRKIVDRLRQEMRDRGVLRGGLARLETTRTETTQVTQTLRMDMPEGDDPEGAAPAITEKGDPAKADLPQIPPPADGDAPTRPDDPTAGGKGPG